MLKRTGTGITRGLTQGLFDTQQLVVLGDPFRAAQRSGFDLGGRTGNCQIGDGRIFCFSRAMRNNCRITRICRHFDSIQGFTQSADLVQLDQDGIGNFLLNTVGKNLRIGNKQIITHQLTPGGR